MPAGKERAERIVDGVGIFGGGREFVVAEKVVNGCKRGVVDASGDWAAVAEILEARLNARNRAVGIEVAQVEFVFGVGFGSGIVLIQPCGEGGCFQSCGDRNLDEAIAASLAGDRQAGSRYLKPVSGERLAVVVREDYAEIDFGDADDESVGLAGCARFFVDVRGWDEQPVTWIQDVAAWPGLPKCRVGRMVIDRLLGKPEPGRYRGYAFALAYCVRRHL